MFGKVSFNIRWPHPNQNYRNYKFIRQVFLCPPGAGLTSEPSTSERVVSLLAEIRNFQEIITKFKEMQVDPTEYACVKAILLFKTSKWSWYIPKRELSSDSCYSQRLEAAITLLVKEPPWGSFCGNHSLSIPWHYFGSHDMLGEWNHLAPLLQKGSNWRFTQSARAVRESNGRLTLSWQPWYWQDCPARFGGSRNAFLPRCLWMKTTSYKEEGRGLGDNRFKIHRYLLVIYW